VNNIGKADHLGIGTQPSPRLIGTHRSKADDIGWLHDVFALDPSDSVLARIPKSHVRVIIAPLREDEKSFRTHREGTLASGARQLLRDTLRPFRELLDDTGVCGQADAHCTIGARGNPHDP